MNDREVTRVLPDGRVASGENADMIAMANPFPIDTNDDDEEEEEFDDGIGEEEMSPDNPDAYPYERDGAGDGDDSGDEDEAGETDDDAEDED